MGSVIKPPPWPPPLFEIISLHQGLVFAFLIGLFLGCVIRKSTNVAARVGNTVAGGFWKLCPNDPQVLFRSPSDSMHLPKSIFQINPKGTMLFADALGSGAIRRERNDDWRMKCHSDAK
ncbi:hypothetical protein CDAR_263201 [Caerostris darwini]|uniref:Uncharacterized protein n=1 Tax=Caerostris darwini TaxID=1538125 RepID=A0AAV4RXN9_9ARAC|nr:hypothetical protein CDAR_263201 [Caerostris darwini]